MTTLFVNAVDESAAVEELLQRVSEQNISNAVVNEYNVKRVRRTYWQRFLNAPPRWQVDYTTEAMEPGLKAG